jgi:hypothetical protein
MAGTYGYTRRLVRLGGNSYYIMVDTLTSVDKHLMSFRTTSVWAGQQNMVT